MLDCESESRQQVGFFKKNPTKGPHLVLNLQALHSKFNDVICDQFLSTGIKLLKKIYHNFSSILHVITGFLQHFETKYFF